MKNTTNVQTATLLSTILARPTRAARVSVATLALIATGCSQTGFSNAATSSNDQTTKSTTTTPGVAACTFDPVDYNLGINVFAFQMTTSDNVNVGFTALGSLLGVNLGVSVNTGDLSMNMTMTDPMTNYAQQVLGTSHLSKTDFSFSVSYDMITAGANVGGQTSITKLATKGVTALLTSADKVVAADVNPWSTRVTDVYSATEFVIPVGSTAGLIYGDQLAIYDNTYPNATGTNSCAGIAYHSSSTPVAVAIPISIEPEQTVMQIVGTPTMAIKAGAGVQVSAFYKAKSSTKRSLKKAVRVASITQSQQLIISDAGSVDMTSYLNNVTVPDITASSGYWIAPPLSN